MTDSPDGGARGVCSAAETVPRREKYQKRIGKGIFQTEESVRRKDKDGAAAQGKKGIKKL